ncbi:hypothetical protein HPB51_019033 [Rhipicephalus microplus]|uniref:Uncharacterized protein n=1 Tax=Rhipicephalus microplus TaxID=6941 RepID=A0A9J6D6Q8_RHIMP|nr:hypothetical protein HPB51_019033 [Rhipicephalus microplus]
MVTRPLPTPRAINADFKEPEGPRFSTGQTGYVFRKWPSAPRTYFASQGRGSATHEHFVTAATGFAATQRLLSVSRVTAAPSVRQAPDNIAAGNNRLPPDALERRLQRGSTWTIIFMLAYMAVTAFALVVIIVIVTESLKGRVPHYVTRDDDSGGEPAYGPQTANVSGHATDATGKRPRAVEAIASNRSAWETGMEENITIGTAHLVNY